MISLAIAIYIAVHDAYNYGHCYSLCKQIKLLMSKILSIIGKKKKNCWKEKWEEKKAKLTGPYLNVHHID